MGQKHQEINVSDLHLWTENPRDPIGEMSETEIIKKIMQDEQKKWNLPKMIKDMGKYYDTSELPTVVFDGKKRPIVYDGNRRIAILKIAQNPSLKKELENTSSKINIPSDFQKRSSIVCNVCDQETALTNIERKHEKDSSWHQLSRDYFQYHFRKEEKSLFIKFEEATGLISKHKFMNEHIVKKFMLTENSLKEIGFSFDKDDRLTSVYNKEDAAKILNKLVQLKKEKEEIRKEDSYKILTPLKDALQSSITIKPFTQKNAQLARYPKQSTNDIVQPKKRNTKRTNDEESLFGGTLSLREGTTNNLYRDICDLDKYYRTRKEKLSSGFPAVIQMLLRLLVETLSSEDNVQNWDNLIKNKFKAAKKQLTQDQKTSLASYQVNNDRKLISALNTGAHFYTTTKSYERAVAMSIILGKILELTIGKK